MIPFGSVWHGIPCVIVTVNTYMKRRDLEFLEVTRLDMMNIGEVVPVHTMMAYRGIGGVALLILNRGTRWK